MMKKRILSAFIAASMALTMIPTTNAIADYDDNVYTINVRYVTDDIEDWRVWKWGPDETGVRDTGSYVEFKDGVATWKATNKEPDSDFIGDNYEGFIVGNGYIDTTTGKWTDLESGELDLNLGDRPIDFTKAINGEINIFVYSGDPVNYYGYGEYTIRLKYDSEDTTGWDVWKWDAYDPGSSVSFDADGIAEWTTYDPLGAKFIVRKGGSSWTDREDSDEIPVVDGEGGDRSIDYTKAYGDTIGIIVEAGGKTNEYVDPSTLCGSGGDTSGGDTSGGDTSGGGSGGDTSGGDTSGGDTSGSDSEVEEYTITLHYDREDTTGWSVWKWDADDPGSSVPFDENGVAEWTTRDPEGTRFIVRTTDGSDREDSAEDPVDGDEGGSRSIDFGYADDDGVVDVYVEVGSLVNRYDGFGSDDDDSNIPEVEEYTITLHYDREDTTGWDVWKWDADDPGSSVPFDENGVAEWTTRDPEGTRFIVRTNDWSDREDSAEDPVDGDEGGSRSIDFGYADDNGVVDVYVEVGSLVNSYLGFGMVGLYGLLGDVNGNGSINAVDISVALRHIAKMETLDEAGVWRADVNSSSTVDAMDITLILRYIAKMIDSF